MSPRQAAGSLGAQWPLERPIAEQHRDRCSTHGIGGSRDDPRSPGRKPATDKPQPPIERERPGLARGNVDAFILPPPEDDGGGPLVDWHPRLDRGISSLSGGVWPAPLLPAFATSPWKREPLRPVSNTGRRLYWNLAKMDPELSDDSSGSVCWRARRELSARMPEGS